MYDKWVTDDLAIELETFNTKDKIKQTYTLIVRVDQKKLNVPD